MARLSMVSLPACFATPEFRNGAIAATVRKQTDWWSVKTSSQDFEVGVVRPYSRDRQNVERKDPKN
jgi:hypothetical protein